MGRRKPGFDVLPGAGSARGGRAYLVIAKLYAVAVAGTCSCMAECILPVVFSEPVAVTKLLAGHGILGVAALHVLNNSNQTWLGCWGWCLWLPSEIYNRKSSLRQTGGGRGHRYCVMVSPCVAAAKTVHAATVGWVVDGMEQCCGAHGCECCRDLGV